MAKKFKSVAKITKSCQKKICLTKEYFFKKQLILPTYVGKSKFINKIQGKNLTK